MFEDLFQKFVPYFCSKINHYVKHHVQILCLYDIYHDVASEIVIKPCIKNDNQLVD